MARQKKLSAVLEKAAQRLNALRSIDPALDLGGGLTLSAFETQIGVAQSALHTYNGLLTQVDAAYNQYLAEEDTVRELSQRMLAGVGSRFGPDSDQYEQAGGTRTSERKRPVRRKSTA